MNRNHFLAASAVLIFSALPSAHAAPKAPGGVPSTEPKMMLEEIDTWSASIADTAFQLADMARSQRDPQSQIAGLDVLREDVNQIGNALQSLEAERDSLSPWEAKALDQTLPLMREVADNAEKAIETFNSSRQHLWATSYPSETAKISDDAGEVKTILRSYLNLAKTREKESRIEHSLGQ